MAQCVLCTSAMACVYCTQDRAFLCAACDKTIHSSNAISRTHRRLPTCGLCHRAAASSFCCGDDAALCQECLVVVHSSNPLAHLHIVLPIDQALTEGKCSLLGPSQPAAGSPSRADDEVSACGTTSAPCNGNGCCQTPQPPAPVAFTGLDELDLDNSWFTGVDTSFDLNEFLGYGYVPSMPPGQEGEEQAEDQQTKGGSASAAMTHLSYQAPVQEDPMIDDFVVPSFLQDSMDFDNSGEGMLTLHHSAQEGEAEQGQGQLPQIEAPAPSSRVGGDNQQMGEAAAMFFGSQCPSSLQVQFVPTVGNDMGFPGSQYAAMIPGMHSMPPQPPAPMRSKPVPAVYIGNGANLTREQRVARYLEKRKNRTFQKTIRYASRKAYAEVRPRIKGRFATKEEMEEMKVKRQMTVA